MEITMKKLILCALVLGSLLFPAATFAGEESLEKLRMEAADENSNVLLQEDPKDNGDVELLYLDKKAFNGNPSRKVVLGSETVRMEF
jgi:hypothetical protein